MNEKPPHCSWLPNSTFLNATERRILLQPADTAPNISPASSLPSFFFPCMTLFQVFLLLCKSIEPSCLNARDIILLFAGQRVTSVFCSPQKSVSSIDVKGSAHRGREISILEARSALWMRMENFCCRNLQASRSLLSWLKPVGLLHKFSCWALAIGKLPHAGLSAVNPSWLFGQDKNHHYLKIAGQM